MIKVEIKPVYNDDGGSRAHQSENAIPNYLEKTITVAGFTVYRKRVMQLKWGEKNIEFPWRI